MPHQIDVTRHEIIGRHMYVYYREPGDSDDHCHTFPVDTFEWRVAEFGFDPEDVETLLGVVLAERWEESPPGELMDVPANLGAADSRALDNVRQAKLARLQAVGLTIAPGAKKQALVAALPAPAQEGIARKMNALFDIRNRGNQLKRMGRPLL